MPRAEANLEKQHGAKLDKAKAGLRPEEIAAAEATLGHRTRRCQGRRGRGRGSRDQLASSQADQSVIEKANPEVAQAYWAPSQSEVARARAAVRTAQSQLAQAEAQAASWRAKADLAKAQLDLAKAGTRSEDVAAAEAAVAIAEAALADAQGNLADLVLRAPFDGVIGAVIAGEGELVSAQTPVVRLGDNAAACPGEGPECRGRRPGACRAGGYHQGGRPGKPGVEGACLGAVSRRSRSPRGRCLHGHLGPGLRPGRQPLLGNDRAGRHQGGIGAFPAVPARLEHVPAVPRMPETTHPPNLVYNQEVESCPRHKMSPFTQVK